MPKMLARSVSGRRITRDDGEQLEPVLLLVEDERLVRRLEALDDLLVVVEEVPDALGRVHDVVEVELELLGQEALRRALEQRGASLARA